MKNRIRKIINLVWRKSLIPLEIINNKWYMHCIISHYRYVGMNIKGIPFYIHSKVHFDGSDYSLITLEEGVSISKNVTFLTHDFSANTVYKGLKLQNKEILEKEFKKNKLLTLKPIRVGEHTFIGMNALILPGSNIGKNCLIGAGSVVRGQIPDNSIVMGNPACVVKRTSDWLEKKNFS